MLSYNVAALRSWRNGCLAGGPRATADGGVGEQLEALRPFDDFEPFTVESGHHG